VIAALYGAVGRLAELVADGDEAAFVNLMRRGSTHLVPSPSRSADGHRIGPAGQAG
jgi:hypothetical protein